jgi:uncharacterized membrane protein
MPPLPVTANPFAQHPGLQALSSELRTNVSGTERTLSGLIGGALVSTSLQSFRPMKTWTLLLGLALLARGASGHCPAYYYMGRTTRH